MLTLRRLLGVFRWLLLLYVALAAAAFTLVLGFAVSETVREALRPVLVFPAEETETDETGR